MDDGDSHTARASAELARHLYASRETIGSPSLRVIAAATDYSHTTVAKAFLPDAAGLSWAVIEQVCASVNADVAVAQTLWSAANQPMGHTTCALDDAQDEDGPEPASGEVEESAESVPLVLRLQLVMWGGLLLCGGVALVVAQALDRDGWRAAMLTEFVQPLFIAVAAGLFGRRAVQSKRSGDRPSQWFFSLLMASSAAWLFGSAAWLLERYLLRHEVPAGPVFDAFFVASYMCAGAALWIRAERYGLARWRSRWRTAVTGVALASGPYALSLLFVSVLHHRSDVAVLMYAVHPAADVALAIAALSPMIHGHRILGSAVLSTAFLAAALSDVAMLLLRDDPDATAVPATASLGYVAYSIIIAVYAVIARPMPPRLLERVLVRRDWLDPRDTVAAVTAAAAVVALVSAAVAVAQIPRARNRCGNDRAHCRHGFRIGCAVGCGIARRTSVGRST
ncbi:hypothetical protein HQO27_14425 [Rhodococcus fascians]|nr:hypothetical protein [Rhodococcus fascians]MBY4431964.1 hypothetical protein [Rhodococcus fascians]